MRGRTIRWLGTEFKLDVVEPYLAGEASLKGLATKVGVDRSLVHYWLKSTMPGSSRWMRSRTRASSKRRSTSRCRSERSVSPLWSSTRSKGGSSLSPRRVAGGR